MKPRSKIVRKVKITADSLINIFVVKTKPNIKGRRGINPNITKAINVTNALLRGDSSFTTTPYYSPKTILAKAFWYFDSIPIIL